MLRFYSASRHPGSNGEFFYNHFFSHYKVDATYKALSVAMLETWLDTTQIRNAAGFSVSMPYKKSIIQYLDSTDPLVDQFDSCNTVRIIDQALHGFNTDYFGLEATAALIPQEFSVQILGDGAISGGYQRFFSQQNREYSVYSRRLGNWGERNVKFDCRINTTAIGTVDSGSPLDEKSDSKLVIDLSIRENRLTKDCEANSIRYIGGLFFYREVFLKQFEVYTQIKPDAEYFDYLLSQRNK